MTAENTGREHRRAVRHHCFNEAAANDRGKSRPVVLRGRGRVAASMRPRPMTAENAAALRSVPGRHQGFNEAAANDRGKCGARACSVRRKAGFNEAAANDRGKSNTRPCTRNSSPGFNEAAANDRGKYELWRPPRRCDRRLQ